ncbi:hypothetical protein OH146_04305 [Salinibacterium sp. SYSU T00001]|uniref:DUF4350 domain-containing protein n=1 Tax=Homoserinimonas sedimenticola TaxID=2986805 RepID=UPI00223589E8|nr:DUF4350 domain-containing protein [Salinibacterium sedimenticola]MCW4384992.1 hypothetical protein [Salinibacterium sedimenticola]
MTVITSTVRTTARRWLYWGVFGAAALVIGLITLFASGANRPLGVPLDPDSAGPAGARALVQVLREQGVAVSITETLESTREAIGTDAATVVLHDRAGILGETSLNLDGLGEHLVLIEPGYDALEQLAPDVAAAGSVSGELEADCTVGAVERAGTVTGDGLGYRYHGDDAAVDVCLDSGDDVASLIRLERGGQTVSVLGAGAALSNERITEAGNAALALGLLGEHAQLVWYVPGVGDLPGEDAASLTPTWVTPVLVLLILVTVAAGVAQGRRLGPLVVENLPVVVRATETMEGRARLYQRSSARQRALDALRVGTVQRLASRLRLPRTAGVQEFVDLAAATANRPAASVRELLVDAVPRSDSELVELSDRLLELEREIARATAP